MTEVDDKAGTVIAVLQLPFPWPTDRRVSILGRDLTFGKLRVFCEPPNLIRACISTDDAPVLEVVSCPIDCQRRWLYFSQSDGSVRRRSKFYLVLQQLHQVSAPNRCPRITLCKGEMGSEAHLKTSRKKIGNRSSDVETKSSGHIEFQTGFQGAASTFLAPYDKKSFNFAICCE